MRLRDIHLHIAQLRVSSLLSALLLAALVPTVVLAATPKPVQANGLAPTTDEAEWLIMVYSDGDDEAIEEDLVLDMQEMELAGSTDKVNIVIQSDRYDGGYDGLGDWTT